MYVCIKQTHTHTHSSTHVIYKRGLFKMFKASPRFLICRTSLNFKWVSPAQN